MISFLGRVLVSGCVLCLCAAPAFARTVTMDVYVQKVDPQARTVSITADFFGSRLLELDVVAKSAVTVDGEPAALKDIKPNCRARLTYDDELEVVRSLKITTAKTAANASGKLDLFDGSGNVYVEAVDEEARTISITTDFFDSRVLTLDVVRKSVITINGQPATLGDIKPRCRGRLKYDEDLDAVVSLDVTPAKPE